MEFWLKVGHIAAMSVWFTGLFFLPRLFVARHRGERDAELDFFVPVAGALYFRLMSPAGLLTIAFGIALIATGPSGAWLLMKLLVVLAAVAVHLYLGVVMFALEHGRDRHGSGFYRALGALPLVLLLAIAALTGAKPRTLPPLPAPPEAAAPMPGTRAP
ncbi:membrane protein [Lysobacter bugurensis]|uniref:Protoporphyrinogen IX oxidase n=1 Tax=Cognatilysobacter bugurensis TaxID=543356 RepID=A0A918W8W1_9GAMM|nr:membrane protein [Lysobacter bugurensis]